MSDRIFNSKVFPRIGHLPTSNDDGDGNVVQPIVSGMFTKGLKYPLTDKVIVTEKVDGACVAVYKDVNDNLHALGRHGFDAHTSKYPHINDFGVWALSNKIADGFDRLLRRCELSLIHI